MIIKTNLFACNRLYNDIMNPNFSNEQKRNSDIKVFLNYLATPRKESDVKKHLEMLLLSENVRAHETIWQTSEVEKIFVDEEKGTIAVLWSDGTKTKSKCAKEDSFDFKVGFALCFIKHMYSVSNNRLGILLEDMSKSDLVVYQNKKTNLDVKEIPVQDNESKPKTTEKKATKPKSTPKNASNKNTTINK